MKNLISRAGKFSLALLMLTGVFLFGMTTGSPIFAGSLTIAVGAFSALHHNGAIRLALTAPIIPDFTEKTEAEFTAMDFEAQVKYMNKRIDHRVKKAEAAKQTEIDELKTQLTGSATKEQIEAIELKHNLIIDEFKIMSLKMQSINDNSGHSQGSKELTPLAKFMKSQSELSKSTAPNAMSEVEIKSIDLIFPYTEKVAAEMSTANVVPNVVGGFSQLFGNYIDPRIHSAPKENAFILSEVNVSFQEGTEDVWWTERLNEEGDAAFIGEGDPKPLIDAEWKDFKTSIKEVAEFWKITERLRNNAPRAVANFREHANELMTLKIDQGVLLDTGAGDTLNGITNQAAAFSVPAELANFYPQANIWDVIMAVATQVRLSNHRGNLTAVLNTVWMAKMAGYKDTLGQYIIPPFATKDGKQVGEVRVRFENGFPDDKILLGDLKKFNVVFSQSAKYAEGLEGSDFRDNKISRRIAAFLAAYIPSTQVSAIVYDDIATIELAIEDITT